MDASAFEKEPTLPETPPSHSELRMLMDEIRAANETSDPEEIAEKIKTVNDNLDVLSEAEREEFATGIEGLAERVKGLESFSGVDSEIAKLSGRFEELEKVSGTFSEKAGDVVGAGVGTTVTAGLNLTTDGLAGSQELFMNTLEKFGDANALGKFRSIVTILFVASGAYALAKRFSQWQPENGGQRFAKGALSFVGIPLAVMGILKVTGQAAAAERVERAEKKKEEEPVIDPEGSDPERETPEVKPEEVPTLEGVPGGTNMFDKKVDIDGRTVKFYKGTLKSGIEIDGTQYHFAKGGIAIPGLGAMLRKVERTEGGFNIVSRKLRLGIPPYVDTHHYMKEEEVKRLIVDVVNGNLKVKAGYEKVPDPKKPEEKTPAEMEIEFVSEK